MSYSLLPEDDLPYPSLTIDMEFESLKVGAEAVEDAIVEANESFKVLQGNSRFWAAECPEKSQHSCKFKVLLRLSIYLCIF